MQHYCTDWQGQSLLDVTKSTSLQGLFPKGEYALSGDLRSSQVTEAEAPRHPSITPSGGDICRGSEWHRTAVNFLHPASPHTEPRCFQWFISPEKGTEGEVNEAAARAAEVRPRREPGAHTHAYTRATERGQACFLLAACYKYYLSGQIFCFENSQIPRTASTHQSKRRGKKCQCFLHPKTSSKQKRSRLLHG